MERHVKKSIGPDTRLDDDARLIIKNWVQSCRSRRRSLRTLATTMGTDTATLDRICDPDKTLLPSLAQIGRLAKLTGEPVPVHLVEAIAYLGERGRKSYQGVKTRCFSSEPLTHPKDLAAWLSDARRALGTLIPRDDLAPHLGARPRKIKSWETAPQAGEPTAKQIRTLARLCQVPVPVVKIDWAEHQPAPKPPPQRVLPIDIPVANTLAEEIFWTGRALSHIASAEKARERNAGMFFARFVTHGKPSTQKDIAKRFQVTNGRVSQIFDQQLRALGVARVRSDCFDALIAALQSSLVPPEKKEWQIRALLGEGLTLAKAAEYGALVLGKRLL
jgi:hypothetical protein